MWHQPGTCLAACPVASTVGEPNVPETITDNRKDMV